jgi:hypothetical protein
MIGVTIFGLLLTPVFFVITSRSRLQTDPATSSISQGQAPVIPNRQ